MKEQSKPAPIKTYITANQAIILAVLNSLAYINY